MALQMEGTSQHQAILSTPVTTENSSSTLSIGHNNDRGLPALIRTLTSLAPGLLPAIIMDSATHSANYKAAARVLYRTALQQKDNETAYRKDPKVGVNSVRALKAIITKAAELSGNNPDEFMLLVNEVILGKDAPNRYLFPKVLNFNRVELGDLGMHPIYQDHSTMQMYHFWAYVCLGFFQSESISKLANVTHEYLEPLGNKIFNNPNWSSTGKFEDYNLAERGIMLGVWLKNGRIKIEQLSIIIEKYLEDPDYLPVTEVVDF